MTSKDAQLLYRWIIATYGDPLERSIGQGGPEPQ
jgi:hypothetical protein